MFVLEEQDHDRFKRDKGDLIMNMVSVSIYIVVMIIHTVLLTQLGDRLGRVTVWL